MLYFQKLLEKSYISRKVDWEAFGGDQWWTKLEDFGSLEGKWTQQFTININGDNQKNMHGDKYKYQIQVTRGHQEDHPESNNKNIQV